MRFADANVFLRYLAHAASDLDQIKAAACFALFQRVQGGEEEITTSEAVIAEVVDVLASPRYYRLSPAEIAGRLQPIISLRGLKLPHKRRLLRALDLYATHTFLDFEAALSVAHMEGTRLVELYSYDTDFDRLPMFGTNAAFRRREP